MTGPASRPEISVVIPAHNASHTIDACLQSLCDQDLPRERFEIIVVENGSTDDTWERIGRYDVHAIRSDQKGQYRAIDRGIEDARGDRLALIDADCKARPDWLRRLAEALDSDPSLGGVGGPLIVASEESLVERYTDYRRILDQCKMLEDHPCSPPFVVTANAMFRMDLVRKIGGFDPNLVPGDADFSWRLQWEGWRVGYAPDAAVEHFHRTTASALWEQVVRYGEGNAELFAKHHARFGRTVWIDPRPYVWLLKALAKIPVMRIASNDPFERAIPVYDFLSNAGTIWGKFKGSWKNKTWVF
jgi:cellulose synthase/poly-beta-1,6-N-acetylglucosamine synthase-like glycosyltransferase